MYEKTEYVLFLITNSESSVSEVYVISIEIKFNYGLAANDIVVIFGIINETVIQVTSDMNTTGCFSNLRQHINTSSVLKMDLIECEEDKVQQLIATFNTVLINDIITKIGNTTYLTVDREFVTLFVDDIPIPPPKPNTSNVLLISKTNRVQEEAADETAQKNDIVYILIVIGCCDLCCVCYYHVMCI